MSHVRGTFQAINCAPMLTYLRVRCASVLVSHPELHSRTGLINSGNLMTGTY